MMGINLGSVHIACEFQTPLYPPGQSPVWSCPGGGKAYMYIMFKENRRGVDPENSERGGGGGGVQKLPERGQHRPLP